MRVRLLSSIGTPADHVPLVLAKANARISCVDEDVLVQSYIDAAVGALSSHLQRAIVRGNYRVTLDAFPDAGDAISLLMPPVVSVTSVQYRDETGAAQTLSASLYLADVVSEPGRIVLVPTAAWPETDGGANAVWVDYVAGYAAGALPATLRGWVLAAVAEMYQNRELGAERPSVPHRFFEELLDAHRVWTV